MADFSSSKRHSFYAQENVNSFLRHTNEDDKHLFEGSHERADDFEKANNNSSPEDANSKNEFSKSDFSKSSIDEKSQSLADKCQESADLSKNDNKMYESFCRVCVPRQTYLVDNAGCCPRIFSSG